MSPQRPDLVLSSDIPHIEFDILKGDSLNIETHGWDRGDVRIELELVQDR